MVTCILNHIVVSSDILSNAKYDLLFSVKEVNKMVLSGVPFRAAYKQVASSIQSGTFAPAHSLNYQHMGNMGSIGNLNLNEIKTAFTALESVFK